MKKTILILLSLLLLIPMTLTSFAENPTSLEAPKDLSTYEDGDSILLRFTIPQSIEDLTVNEELDGDLLYCIDWKVNNGSWHFDDPVINRNTYDWDEDSSYIGYVVNKFWDELNVLEHFLTHWDFGLSDAIDLVNNKYTFRVRFAFYDFEKDEDANYITSPFSNEVSIGGGANIAAPDFLEAPANLKVETRKNDDGSPYFTLSWTNLPSITEINKSFPIKVKVDMKVGNEPWYSETHNHDWWGGVPYSTSTEFDPIEKQYTDKIVIEENLYYFRILYAYEPLDTNRIVSGFSNTVSVGVSQYEKASEWAKPELQNAYEQGLVPDSLYGVDMTKSITREEFCEIAVLLYEKTTGKTVEPVSPNPFNDTNNPQILKAYALEIAKGTKVGTSNIPFEPKRLINREECATMLYRTIKKIAPEGDYTITDVKDFPDQKYISSWAVEGTKYMFKLGIIKGDSKGNFMPKASTTAQEGAGYGMASREAAIVMSSRTYDKRDQLLTGTGNNSDNSSNNQPSTNVGIINENKIPEGYRRDLIPIIDGSRITMGMKGSSGGINYHELKYYTGMDYADAVTFHKNLIVNADSKDKNEDNADGYTFEGIMDNVKISIKVRVESYDIYNTCCEIKMQTGL